MEHARALELLRQLVYGDDAIGISPAWLDVHVPPHFAPY